MRTIPLLAPKFYAYLLLRSCSAASAHRCPVLRYHKKADASSLGEVDGAVMDSIASAAGRLSAIYNDYGSTAF